MPTATAPSPAEELRKLLPTLATDSRALVEHLSTLRSQLLADDGSAHDTPTHHRHDQRQPKGLSLLALKNDALLSYTHHLVLLAAHQLRGHSIAGPSGLDASRDSAADREAARLGQRLVHKLVRLRLRLEKLRPVEARARHQLERLVRAANDAERGVVVIGGGQGSTKSRPRDVDVGLLAFRPDLSALMGDDDGDHGAGDADSRLPAKRSPSTRRRSQRDDDEAGTAPSEGVYRPPRLAPVVYDPDARRRRSRRGEGGADDGVPGGRRSANASLLADVALSMTSAPVEQSAGGVGVEAMGSAASSARARALARLQRFEEDNFTRVQMSKRDAKKRRRDEADVALGGAGVTGARRGASGERVGGGLEEEFGEILRNASAATTGGGGGKAKRRRAGAAGTGARNDAYDELRSHAVGRDALGRARQRSSGRGGDGGGGGTFDLGGGGGGSEASQRNAGRTAFGKAVKRAKRRGGAA